MRASDSEWDDALKVLTADAGAAGQRLDQWLARELAPEISRSRIQQLVKQGNVSIDGCPVTEAKLKLREGAVIELVLPEPEPAEPKPENIQLDVLYEDDQLIVIDKPAGLVVHPGPGNWSGTLVNALLHHCGDSLSGIGGVRRPGIVHRLDKDTSGVMVVAKTDTTHRALAAQFADHGREGELERAYAALVWGAPPRDAGTIEAPLGRSTRDRTQRAVVREDHPDARHAITHYHVDERFYLEGGEPIAALVECRLETGRTHQIRVHMAHLGHPLVGDADYGAAFKTKVNKLPEPVRLVVGRFARQALHARLLAFRHPTLDEVMAFETELPEDFQVLLHGFRKLDRRVK